MLEDGLDLFTAACPFGALLAAYYLAYMPFEFVRSPTQCLKAKSDCLLNVKWSSSE